MTQETTESIEFERLADYRYPALPTDEYVRRIWKRIAALLRKEEEKPFIAGDKLRKATLDTLDEVVAPPACGPLLDELQASFTAWRADPARASHILTIVLPPCDQNAIIETWASRHGHTVLDPPKRSELISTSLPEIASLDGDGVLVIPKLERWFLRQRNGLATVRALLAALGTLQRPVVLGCNSWAWAFLSKAAGAAMILPEPVTFRAFDVDRLHNWLSELAFDETTGSVRFRLPANGTDVLSRDEDGKPASDFLQTLAAQSLGIPWVAWHMWRRSLRSGGDPDLPDEATNDMTDASSGEQTLWIAALDEFVLPGADDQTALLVLQALLIHGALTTDELRIVLPIVGESNIAPVLVRSGFVERRGETYTCRPAAYPAIREGLLSAGFPKDAL